MREELLKELEQEYEAIRSEDEHEESMRRGRIRTEYPEIYKLVLEREGMIYGTLRSILKGTAETKELPVKMKELSSRIRSMLNANGLPEDYLAPVYRCPVCRDTGRTGETVKEPCECLKRAYSKKLREKIGLIGNGETFEKFDLNVFSNDKIQGQDFTQRELMSLYRKICEKWAREYPYADYRDLVLMGSTGLGKTFLMRSMAERLIERDVNVLIISAYRMLEILRNSYFDNDRGNAAELSDVEVLMIDDLGSEPLMQNVTVEQLFNLLNERQNKGLSTVISTNLDMARFKERYSERIASRLRDSRHCKVLNLLGEDIRTGGRRQA